MPRCRLAAHPLRAGLVAALLGVGAWAWSAPPPLRACADSSLQAALEGAMGEMGLAPAVAARRYILVGLAEDPRGGEWLERLAAPIDRLLTHQAPD